MVGAGENFALRVKGDSMVGDGILDGDYVVVRKQQQAENGQTVVALIDGEATVKRLAKKGATVELHPANPAMQPIVVARMPTCDRGGGGRRHPPLPVTSCLSDPCPVTSFT